MFTIAFAGQFDHFLPDFIHWFSKNVMPDCNFVGLNHQSFRELSSISWRIGSLLSSRDTEGMLNQIDALVYFGMTPPSLNKTDEGIERDVALSAAVNVASAAKLFPDLRVILVTRNVQNEHPKLGSCSDYWLQIVKIFKDSVQNLNVIQTNPVISELDAVCVAMFENAQQKLANRPDSIWKKSFQPVKKRDFYDAIKNAITGKSTGNCTILHGDCSIEWLDWIKVNQRAIPSSRQPGRIAQMRNALFPENHLRAELLDEVISDSSSNPSHNSSLKPYILAEMLQIAEDLLDDKIANKPLLLAPGRFHIPVAGKSSCYVQRILTRPLRSVSDIADLLMGWIPRYFQRMIRVEELSASRIMCRMSRIPVLEFEKIIESPNRCRLLLRSPWALNVKNTVNLVVATTGYEKDPGILFVIVEDAPKNLIFMSSFRAMMIAFGRYLKDYGCGE